MKHWEVLARRRKSAGSERRRHQAEGMEDSPFPQKRRVIGGHVPQSLTIVANPTSPFTEFRAMSLRQSIETYILAKDGNRPHLMSRAFVADAELLMNVKTEEISFPATVKGLTDITATLVSQFAQRYENVYTFCAGTPPKNSTEFRCRWLVCMTEKLSGAVRVGFGDYQWLCRDDSGTISKLEITIEAMKTLPSELSDSILEWARILPYPWCAHGLPLQSAPNVPVVQEIAENLARFM